jgi:hypothetical protein
MCGNVARTGDGRGAYRVLVGKPEGRRYLGRLRHGWEDNINMDLQEVGWGSNDWIDLAQVQVASSCKCGNEHSGSIKFGEFLVLAGELLACKKTVLHAGREGVIRNGITFVTSDLKF